MTPVVRGKTPPAAAAAGVDFGSLDSTLYAGGFLLPEGDYALEFTTVLHSGFGEKAKAANRQRLGVMVNCYPLTGGDAIPQFYSMGGKAHEAFVPSADGKGLDPVVGGSGQLSNKSNWHIFRESLYNSGLPVGIFSDNLSVLDGIHVHTQNVPEPEERKSFGTRTGEVEQETRPPGLIPIVVEIKEDGKPWEGSGGFPAEAPAAAPAKPAVKTPAKPATPAARPVARVAAPAPIPAAEEAAGDEDEVQNAVINGIATVLSQKANVNGMKKLMLRTASFKAITDASGAETAQAAQVMFNNDETLNGLLNQLGYQLIGSDVAKQ